VGYRKLYLRAWEQLAFEPEVYTDDPDGFFQQPLHLSNKRDSVVYVSGPLPQDTEVVGPAAFYLYAAIDQDDTNWFVSVSDVAPGGAEQRVTGGSLKASHRAIDPARSVPEAPWHPHTNPEPCVSGEVYEYPIELAPVGHVFLKGHRVKLEIKSMVSPKDPEMVVHFHPVLCSAKPTLHKIYRSQQYPSHLLLPVISR
jgi:putative CocE/NonD family hydrolase